ncbi:putative protein serine/threonine kinase [Heterostelium album PN500]|uniref:Uncharacterized protein n=1 Tax=Heterostelium pallidum (strain ATCC 26659 / Pp 5 / PN500) TaxID=670386 RepID=D3B3D7_HETP5|nr:putative protein serine/threonine kinase [Heterostelium album PN500]EFA83835.1 putative protein serine/threonine kinase [Heterostelium album PN500]|eukprot:XP_020435952.1 putative protein serine/threonine kinase [Heterostelium album PN500]
MMYLVATADYNGATENHLTFVKGTKIEYIEKAENGFVKGKLDGKIGLLPSSHITIETRPLSVGGGPNTNPLSSSYDGSSTLLSSSPASNSMINVNVTTGSPSTTPSSGSSLNLSHLQAERKNSTGSAGANDGSIPDFINNITGVDKKKKREESEAGNVGLFHRSRSGNTSSTGKRRYANRKKCPRLYISCFEDIPSDIIDDLQKEEVAMSEIRANLKVFLTILKFLTRQKITFVYPDGEGPQSDDEDDQNQSYQSLLAGRMEEINIINSSKKQLETTTTTTSTSTSSSATTTPTLNGADVKKPTTKPRSKTMEEIQTSSIEVDKEQLADINDEAELKRKTLELKLQRKRRLAGASTEFLAEASLSIKTFSDIKKKIKFGNLIGKGGYGKVFEAHYEKKKVAIKVVHYRSPKEQHNVLIEIGFLQRCNHPNIIEFKAAVLHDNQLFIVTEFMQGGTLEQAVNSAHIFKETHIGFIAKEILKGIAYLHERKLVHRDIKSGNVMITINGDIKLIDFGLCSSVEKGTSNHMVGSPYWMPPEMIKGDPHSYPADIWSFGVCVLEMMFRKPPNRDSRLKAMFTNATKGIDVTKFKCSLDLKDMLWQCFEMDPKKRSSANKLLRHPFFQRAESKQGMKGLFDNMFLQRNLNTSGFFN